MVRADAVPTAGRLGICQPQDERQATLLAGNDAEVLCAAYRQTPWHHQADRLAHLPPNFGNAARQRGERQDHARTHAARECRNHDEPVRTGADAGETCSALKGGGDDPPGRGNNYGTYLFPRGGGGVCKCLI